MNTFTVGALAPANVQKAFEERPEADYREVRALKLVRMGLIYNGEAFVYQDINFHWTDITCMTPAEFNRAYEGAVRRMAVLKAGGSTFNKEVV